MKRKAPLLPSGTWRRGEVLTFQSSLGEGIPTCHTGPGLAWMVSGCILILLFLWDLHMDAQAGLLATPRGWSSLRVGGSMGGASVWLAAAVGSSPRPPEWKAASDWQWWCRPHMHGLQEGRLKPESHLLSSLRLQIKVERDFWTLLLVLRVAGFCLCEIGLQPGSPPLPNGATS